MPQVHKAECPGTFVIGPELSTAEALQLAGGGPCPAQDALSSWTDGLAAIFSGEREGKDGLLHIIAAA